MAHRAVRESTRTDTAEGSPKVSAHGNTGASSEQAGSTPVPLDPGGVSDPPEPEPPVPPDPVVPSSPPLPPGTDTPASGTAETGPWNVEIDAVSTSSSRQKYAVPFCSPASRHEYEAPIGEDPRPGIRELVSRVHGPCAQSERYRWKPRLSSSEVVCQDTSTAPSAPAAVNDMSFTAVVTELRGG